MSHESITSPAKLAALCSRLASVDRIGIDTEFVSEDTFRPELCLVQVATRDGLAVIDPYQGKGIGAALMRHLAAIARGAGLRELVAEVLPENAPMLKVFEKSGFRMTTKREPRVVHVALRLS